MQKSLKINLYIVSKRHLLILSLLMSLLVFLSCDRTPDPKTEQAWQQSFREALIDGYTNFKGHFVDADVSVYIFSYKFPSNLTSKNIFSIFQEQIKDYNVISDSKNELVLRKSNTVQMYEAFNEYRFLINEQHMKITVMFASIDSPVEIKNYSVFINEFQKASRLRNW